MNQGYYGNTYDRYVERNEQSTLHQMKKTYYTTKQAVFKKLGKKEDKHVVASDQELDSKIEVFRAIQKSCMDLLRVIEKYQDRICALSQEENAMGRFLKSQSQQDKTRAGKMMAAVGKSQSFSSQQRLALRVPLVRLYQEVETFRYRAISDTLMTINRMEAARTEYRGALLWMKDVSEELDPDTYKQLEKFRKVQAQVKKTKAKFDKLKLDTMQKIDLLAASRCNMFSHVLANYQSTLLHFWDKTSRTMSAVTESFKGYQHYEFNMLKELAEPSRKLAEETSHREAPERDTNRTKPGLISFGEDETQGLVAEHSTNSPDTASLENLFEDDEYHDEPPERPQKNKVSDDGDQKSSKFIEFDEKESNMEGFDFSRKNVKVDKKSKANGAKDLLSDDIEPDEGEKDDMTLLNEILNAPSTGGDDFSLEWQAVFGSTPLSTGENYTPVETDQPPEHSEFMPSALLDMTAGMEGMSLGQGDPRRQGMVPGQMMPGMGQMGPSRGMPPMASVTQEQQRQQQQQQQQLAQQGAKGKPKKGAKDMSAWFNLFADLDPLANPDAVGKSEADASDAL